MQYGWMNFVFQCPDMLPTTNKPRPQTCKRLMIGSGLIVDKVAGVGHVYKLKHMIDDTKREYGINISYDKHMIDDTRREYGVNISYDKAWRARETIYSLHKGSLGESYLCHMIMVKP